MATPLAKVEGLGSAKGGTRHWWQQRASALALLPLTVWFVVSMASLAGADHGTLVTWMRLPLVTALLVLFIGLLFFHFQLGARVVIEDYVPDERGKFLALAALNAFVWVFGLLAMLPVLRIFFEGAS